MYINTWLSRLNRKIQLVVHCKHTISITQTTSSIIPTEIITASLRREHYKTQCAQKLGFLDVIYSNSYRSKNS